MTVLRQFIFLLLWAVLVALPQGDACGADSTVSGLSREEAQWLADHPVIKVGVGVAFPPFQWVEESGGSHVFRGMAADYLRILSLRFGVHFQPVFGISFREALERGKRGEIDAFACVAVTAQRSSYLTYTNPYLAYPLVIIGRENGSIVRAVSEFGGRRVATVKSLATYSRYVNEYPDVPMQFVFERTVPDVLQAVSDGRADVCAVNLAVAIRLMRDMKLRNLKIMGGTPWTNELAMAAANHNPHLAGILQKGLDSISMSERDRIARNWLEGEGVHVVTDDAWSRWVPRVGGGLVIAIALILAWNWRLHIEVDKRKEVEQELSRKEKIYRGLFESMHNGFALCEWLDGPNEMGDWRYIEVNPAFEQHTKLAAVDVVGKTEREVSPEVSQERFNIIRNVVRYKDPATFERYSEALKRDFQVSVFPVWENRFGMQIADVTARRKTMDLMVRHEKILSLGSLAAGMAHEINNPLGGVLQGAQNIQRRLLPTLETNREHAASIGVDISDVFQYMQTRGVLRMLDGIVDSGARAADIVAMLLEFSGGNGEDLRNCDMREIVEEVLDVTSRDVRLGHAFETGRLTIRREFDTTSEPAFCSASEIRQVVFNLVRNAVMAATSDPDNQGVVTVRVREGVGHITVSVTDNGPGMDKQAIQQVFDPFYTTRDPGMGTGLALAVSYIIITQNHGGTIDVDSAPGKGATFSFTLPYSPVRTD